MSAAPLRDYYVTFLREEYIAEGAAIWRDVDRESNIADFNITRFIQETLTTQLHKKKGNFVIDYFDLREPGDDPAYVTIEPLTLHVDREVWAFARLGDPEARHILAHETGHIILHGDYPKAAFSRDPKIRLKAFLNENSAEWQAETFAEYFLLPTRIVAAFPCPEEIAWACSVPIEMAEKRFARVREEQIRKRRRSPDYCATCGEFGCQEH